MIEKRKAEHLEVCIEKDVEFTLNSTLLEDVHLVHEALPELRLEDIDTCTAFMGKDMRAPLLISAMTGGTEKAGRINRELARAANELGIGFCLGSQRPMLEDPSKTDSYLVRDVAPDILILGNIGIQQAIHADPDDIEKLVTGIEADGIAIHLNPAMELAQVGGDTDFTGGYKLLTVLTRKLPGKIMVKETGCGISRTVGAHLREAGVQVLDTGGAGGTSWPKVERLRDGKAEGITSWLDEWGLPTAVSLMQVSNLGFELVGSGGIRNGLDVAKSLVLGADVAGMALPVLRVYNKTGYDGVVAYISNVIEDLKKVMLLVGAGDISALKKHTPVITGRLSEWMKTKR